MTGHRIVVTIDGPAGAGKTTVSRILAARLGYKYVDTGALYRGIALGVKESGIDPNDEVALADLCRQTELRFEIRKNGLRLMSNSHDITDKIRTPEITMMASAVSARPGGPAVFAGCSASNGKRKGGRVRGGVIWGTVVFPS